jgi:phenazine biosynthesis-like protein
MTIRVPFYFVDVFASQPLTGNPLSLVPDADDLTESQMRAIAREFNQSQTTFVLEPSRPEATWRLRSFTPVGAEVSVAGPRVRVGGWAWWWPRARLPYRAKRARAVRPLASSATASMSRHQRRAHDDDRTDPGRRVDLGRVIAQHDHRHQGGYADAEVAGQQAGDGTERFPGR